MSKKKKQHPTVKKIQIAYLYDEMIEEWIVAYGVTGNIPLGFGEGTNLTEMHTDAINQIRALETHNIKYKISYVVDENNIPSEKLLLELKTFLSLNAN